MKFFRDESHLGFFSMNLIPFCCAEMMKYWIYIEGGCVITICKNKHPTPTFHTPQLLVLSSKLQSFFPILEVARICSPCYSYMQGQIQLELSKQAKFKNLLYFWQRAIAFPQLGSVHRTWHMHFVAKTFDSSHGMCNATFWFGKEFNWCTSISFCNLIEATAIDICEVAKKKCQNKAAENFIFLSST